MHNFGLAVKNGCKVGDPVHLFFTSVLYIQFHLVDSDKKDFNQF